MRDYSETEKRNLRRSAVSERRAATRGQVELFAEDGIWWNGLPLAHSEGRTEHRGRAEIRKLLPSQNTTTTLGVGRDRYDMARVRWPT